MQNTAAKQFFCAHKVCFVFLLMDRQKCPPVLHSSEARQLGIFFPIFAVIDLVLLMLRGQIFAKFSISIYDSPQLEEW